MISIVSPDTISIQLGGSPATTNPVVYSSFFDSTINQGVTNTTEVNSVATTGATPVVICPAPAAGTTRNLSSLYMPNIDTSPVTASIIGRVCTSQHLADYCDLCKL